MRLDRLGDRNLLAADFHALTGGLRHEDTQRRFHHVAEHERNHRRPDLGLCPAVQHLLWRVDGPQDLPGHHTRYDCAQMLPLRRRFPGLPCQRGANQNGLFREAVQQIRGAERGATPDLSHQQLNGDWTELRNRPEHSH